MKLLCATDLRPGSDAAVERACRLRDALHASLKLVHVVSPISADEGTLEQRLLSASSRMALRARHAGCPAELVVRCGRPASIVSEEAATTDIIIVGAHDPGKSLELLGGAFTGKVLSAARRPMLIVKRPAGEPYRRILLALDGSQVSGRVVRLAERLPTSADASYALVHAHEPPYEAMMNTIGVGNLSVAGYASASMDQAAAMIHSRLRLHSLDWRRYRVLLVDARPGTAIRQAMRENQPDLLVMGTRGHGRFRRALLGSTAHEMLAAADCDVLLVPEPAHHPEQEDDPAPPAA